MHYKLCNLSDTINSAYEVQFVLITLYAFSTLVSTLFYFVRQIIVKNTEELTLHYMLYAYNMILFCFLQICIVSLICSNTASEVSY